MVARYQPKVNGAGGDYFSTRSLQFISTGCTLLDCVIGGGWPLGRIANIVGDKSAGKTLLAIEACANFAEQYPNGKIRYREAEAAFDVDYAKVLGLPVDRVDFGPEGIDTLWNTIEDIFEDLEKAIKQDLKASVPSLYIVDSLDALSSRDELARDRTKGTFGVAKPKVLSEMFRHLSREFKHAKMCVIFISQIRDKIGVTFGAKYSRAGGKALDFYASQVLYLSHIQTLNKTINGVKRAYAVHIKAKCTKNKISLPFRDCEFVIKFGYGVDDLAANVNWLEEVGKLGKIGIKSKEGMAGYLTQSEKLKAPDYWRRVADVRDIVKQVWQDIEVGFQPKRQKYGSHVEG